MHSRSLPQLAGWFNGKGIDLHPWVSGSIPTNDIGFGQR